MNRAKTFLKNKLPYSASLALHALIFSGALIISANHFEPLPVGVELLIGDGGSPAVAEISKTEKQQRPQVADSSDAPTVSAVPVEKNEPIANTSSAGSATGTSSQGALTGREGVANGSEVSPEQRYLHELKTLLERRKRYPVMAKKMKQTGTVTLRFTLAADGSLVESEVIEKAAHDSLNTAALELVKGIHGLKPFPEEIQKTSWSITVPIEYVLN